MKALYLFALLWAISAWAIPLLSTSAELAYPTLTHVLVVNLCWRVHEGTEAEHAVCHYLGPQPLDTGDDEYSAMIEKGKHLWRTGKIGASKLYQNSSKHPAHAKVVYRRSDDHLESGSEENSQGNGHNDYQKGVAKTTAKASQPTETTSEESHTNTKGESTATAASLVSSHGITQSSTENMSKTEASKPSDTKTTSATESSTSVVTGTSKASATTSHPSRARTTTAQAKQTSYRKFDMASYHRSSIAAGVIFGSLASIAVACVFVMYIRKWTRAWKRRQQGRLGDSVLPLVEDGRTSRSGTAQGYPSRMPDHGSPVWAPIQPSESSVTVAAGQLHSTHEMTPISTNSGSNDFVGRTPTDSQGSSSNSIHSQIRGVTGLIPSVIVVPPTPSPVLEMPNINTPVPSAEMGSGDNRDRTGESSARTGESSDRTPMTPRHQSRHSEPTLKTHDGSTHPSRLPFIPRWSASPIFNVSDHMGH
ncbi:hypothetical protein DTO271G3_4503 [Paecilomyces variotii]|nr:hypothetical protein DTO271G3_4503 [Paecilomyces variotii]